MSILKPFITILSHPTNKGHFFKALSTIGWWKLNQLFFHLPSVVEIAPGTKIICYPNNSYGSFIVYAKWPEFEELQFIHSVMGSKGIYVDVGAHIGDSSLLAASKIKTGKVIACEPTPSIFEELLANIKLNNFEKKIIPLQKAISEKVGTAYFSLEAASEVNHLKLKAGKGKSIKVATTTIDAIVREQKINKISLLKIDVEGFELEVLLGSRSSLKKEKIEMILFEVNPVSVGIDSKVNQIEKLLLNNKFELYSFDKRGLLNSLNNLYVPEKTINFVAILKKKRNLGKLKKWIK